MKHHNIVFCLFILFAFLCASSAKAEILHLQSGIKQITLNVEIAQTPDQRARGLMDREYLAQNSGMLFLFEQPTRPSFWMKNTLIPLDILFFDENGVVMHIHEQAKPMDLTLITPPKNVSAALEIGGGEAKKQGIIVGSVLLEKSLIKSLEVR